MLDALMVLELAKLRQQELIEEAARQRLANQLGSNSPAPNPRYVGAVHERLVRRCVPVNLKLRRSAG